MKKILLVALAICLIASTAAFATVVGSYHDLGTGGDGTHGTDIAGGTGQVCVFCHHPHRGQVTGLTNAILWNITNWDVTSYPVYDDTESATIDATDNANVFNDGTSNAYASYFCLACHDGTIGANALVRPPRDGSNTSAYTLPGAANLGTTLEDDHPVNFTVDAALFTNDGELRTPFNVSGTGSAYPLFPNKMQCATCHDVHRGTLTTAACTSTDSNSCDPNIEFMLGTTVGSDICIDCHVK